MKRDANNKVMGVWNGKQTTKIQTYTKPRRRYKKVIAKLYIPLWLFFLDKTMI